MGEVLNKETSQFLGYASTSLFCNDTRWVRGEDEYRLQVAISLRYSQDSLLDSLLQLWGSKF